MHALSIAAISAVATALHWFGFAPSEVWQTTLLGVGVALFGVPHGALDASLGQRLLRPFFGLSSLPAFLIVYVSVSCAVVVGWYVAPVVTCLLFFLVSAWHFGLEEDYASTSQGWPKHAVAVARGCPIVCLPAIFQASLTCDVLATVIPTGGVLAAERIVTSMAISVPLLGLAALDLSVYCICSKARLHRKTAVLLRVSALSVLACTVHPCLAFAVYFCGWHSLRGLSELRNQVGGQLDRFVLKLMPITLLTLLLGAGAMFAWARTTGVVDATIRTAFLGLSAIAFPHLLLHASRHLPLFSLPLPASGLSIVASDGSGV